MLLLSCFNVYLSNLPVVGGCESWGVICTSYLVCTLSIRPYTFAHNQPRCIILTLHLSDSPIATPTLRTGNNHHSSQQQNLSRYSTKARSVIVSRSWALQGTCSRGRQDDIAQIMSIKQRSDTEQIIGQKTVTPNAFSFLHSSSTYLQLRASGICPQPEDMRVLLLYCRTRPGEAENPPHQYPHDQHQFFCFQSST